MIFMSATVITQEIPKRDFQLNVLYRNVQDISTLVVITFNVYEHISRARQKNLKNSFITSSICLRKCVTN